MVGLARIAVSEVYDSASGEAVFSEHMVHDDVVFMRIYADGVCLPERPVEQASCCVVARFCDCYPMYYVVGRVIRPFPIEDLRVCGIRAFDEGHCGDDSSVFAQHHA